MSFIYNHFLFHNTSFPLIYLFPLHISSNGYTENANYGLIDSEDSPRRDPSLRLKTMQGAKSYPRRVKWDYMELIQSSMSFNFIFFPPVLVPSHF